MKMPNCMRRGRYVIAADDAGAAAGPVNQAKIGPTWAYLAISAVRMSLSRSGACAPESAANDVSNASVAHHP
jgi:hypothetical protein